MALRSGLSVYLYVGPPIYGSPVVQEIASLLDQMTISTLAPGGFGEFTGLIRIRSAKVPRPQFGLFARVAIMDGPFCVFLGELQAPAYGLNLGDGEYIKLSAVGLGNCLRDVPGNYAYTAQTAQQIAQAQLALHTGGSDNALTALLSTDNTQLFADNPTNSITQVYAGRNMEEILADAALEAGDYDWGTEADPNKKDLAGFPLGRLYARARQLSTVDYTALIGARDLYALEFTPTADRAYNYIEVDYANGTSGVGVTFAKDPRLNADLSQGTAPFRYRKYLRDLAGMSVVNATIAQSIANTQLALFENVTYSGAATLRGVRDANGNPLPLWQMRAGHNLFVPEYAIQGSQLPTTPTQNVNLFWITSATYREDSTGQQQVDLELGYVANAVDVQVARLQMGMDALSRARQSMATVQALGAPMRGQYAISFSGGIAGQTVGTAVEFPALGYQPPTSLSLSSIATSNIGALGVTDLTAVGAYIFGTVSANGAGYARGTYKTVGNCLLAVDPVGMTFDQHCEGCGAVHHGLAITAAPGGAAHLAVSRDDPAHYGLAFVCPSCGSAEAFNCALGVADAQATDTFRASQSRLIRTLQSAVGIPLVEQQTAPQTAAQTAAQ